MKMEEEEESLLFSLGWWRCMLTTNRRRHLSSQRWWHGMRRGGIYVGRWWVIIAGGRRLVVVLIIRGQLVVKLNEAIAPCHLRALVLTKFRPIFSYGVLNVYLVILLIHYSINCDPSVPRWNWAAINCLVSRRLGLAECHLVFCLFVGGCTTWHWPVQWCCPMDEAHSLLHHRAGSIHSCCDPWTMG
jgi:hypothetical protein